MKRSLETIAAAAALAGVTMLGGCNYNTKINESHITRVSPKTMNRATQLADNPVEISYGNEYISVLDAEAAREVVSDYSSVPARERSIFIADPEQGKARKLYLNTKGPFLNADVLNAMQQSIPEGASEASTFTLADENYNFLEPTSARKQITNASGVFNATFYSASDRRIVPDINIKLLRDEKNGDIVRGYTIIVKPSDYLSARQDLQDNARAKKVVLTTAVGAGLGEWAGFAIVGAHNLIDEVAIRAQGNSLPKGTTLTEKPANLSTLNPEVTAVYQTLERNPNATSTVMLPMGDETLVVNATNIRDVRSYMDANDVPTVEIDTMTTEGSFWAEMVYSTIHAAADGALSRHFVKHQRPVKKVFNIVTGNGRDDGTGGD